MSNNINDDAQAWYDSMGQQIQDFEVPPMPESEPTPEEAAEVEEAQYLDDHPYADAPRVSSEDASSVINMQRIQRPTASVIVGVMDTLLPIVIALIFKGSEQESLKLDDGERETLVDAWAQYLGTKNVQASPAAVLITTIVTIYGAKVFIAWQQRQAAIEEQRRREQEAEQARQAEQQAAIEAERAARKTRKQEKMEKADKPQEQ